MEKIEEDEKKKQQRQKMTRYSNLNSHINTSTTVYKEGTISQDVKRQLEEKIENSTKSKSALYSNLRFDRVFNKIVSNEEYLEKEKALLSKKNSQAVIQKDEKKKNNNKTPNLMSIRDVGKDFIGLSMNKQDYSFLDSNFYLLGNKSNINETNVNNVKN